MTANCVRKHVCDWYGHCRGAHQISVPGLVCWEITASCELYRRIQLDECDCTKCIVITAIEFWIYFSFLLFLGWMKGPLRWFVGNVQYIFDSFHAINLPFMKILKEKLHNLHWKRASAYCCMRIIQDLGTCDQQQPEIHLCVKSTKIFAAYRSRICSSLLEPLQLFVVVWSFARIQ